jgi:hypothetical protein
MFLVLRCIYLELQQCGFKRRFASKIDGAVMYCSRASPLARRHRQCGSEGATAALKPSWKWRLPLSPRSD